MTEELIRYKYARPNPRQNSQMIFSDNFRKKYDIFKKLSGKTVHVYSKASVKIIQYSHANFVHNNGFYSKKFVEQLRKRTTDDIQQSKCNTPTKTSQWYLITRTREWSKSSCNQYQNCQQRRTNSRVQDFQAFCKGTLRANLLAYIPPRLTLLKKEEYNAILGAIHAVTYLLLAGIFQQIYVMN